MRLGDLCTIEIGLKDADFWVVRRAKTREGVGEVARTLAPGLIGIKVKRTDILVPDYLRYLFEYLRGEGVFAVMSRSEGALGFVLPVEALRSIPLEQRR